MNLYHSKSNPNSFWFPPIPNWKPLKKFRNSSLRIAAIVGERLMRGLMFEGELLLLTPMNWKKVLHYARPDILLVESIEKSTTDHWYQAQYQDLSEKDNLISIIKKAQALSIPTVFWMTHGYDNIEKFQKITEYFDFVCCADQRAVDQLSQHNINAELLPPCVQPALHNPFRHYDQKDLLNLNILFDGWADIDHLKEKLSVLHKLQSFGLNIIESRPELFQTQLKISSEYSSSILGCVTPEIRLNALKYATAYATHNATLSSKIEQQWMSFEAAASGIPVVHCGILDERDIRKDFVVECKTEMEFLIEFARQNQDSLYRKRVAHLGWRNVNIHHTFAHRLQRICNLMGIHNDWEKYPKASLIVPSFRKDLLHKCITTYEQMDYPNKELIIVLNDNTSLNKQDLKIQNDRDDIIIESIPADVFAGAALDLGHLCAEGQYCFRIDDDDYYGSNYILDMILQARSIDADFFGKSPAPIVFQGDERIYVKKDSIQNLIIPLELLQMGNIWFGGNSVSGKSDFFKINGYGPSYYGAADTGLLFNIQKTGHLVTSILDQFNLLAERRKDVSTHTWKDSVDLIKKNRDFLEDISGLII